MVIVIAEEIHSGESVLEPVCCKKRQKSPNQETGLGNRGPLEILNDTKLILNGEGGHSCSFQTNLVSFRTFRRPLFPKPVSWLGLFCRFLQQDGSSMVAWALAVLIGQSAAT